MKKKERLGEQVSAFALSGAAAFRKKMMSFLHMLDNALIDHVLQ